MPDIAPAALSTADTDYLRAMIAHHATAIEMSRKYLATPAGQRLAVVSDLARNVITAQAAETAKMRDWLGVLASQAGDSMSM